MTTVRPTPGRRHRSGLQLLGGVLAALAVFGSVALFFTDDARLLRLGLVSLLWVAFGSLVVVVRSRKDAETAQARSREQRVVYELELEREVRARRDHELHTERVVREEVGAQVRAEGRLELDELRDELKVLRESLSVLLSGDLLVERVALRAESTRLRSLTDTARVEAAAAPGQLVGAVPIEAETVEPEPVEPEPLPVVPEPVPLEPEPVVPEPEPLPVVPEPEPVVPEPVVPELEPVVVAEPITEPVAVVVLDAAPAAGTLLADERPGGHRRRAEEPVAPSVAEPGTLAEPEVPEVGAHSNGRSVSDMLAAYGGASTEGGRRRRTED